MLNYRDMSVPNHYIDRYIGQRFEFKYLLDPELAHQIEVYIQKIGLGRSEHSKNGPYIVNSLYFDTPLLGDHRDKDGSFLIRRKLRARIYQNSWFTPVDKVWLEIKKKRNMNITKTRVRINGAMWEKFITESNPMHLTSEGLSGDDKQTMEEFRYLYKRHLYRPHVVVRYLRTAYFGNFLSPVKITFDKNIQACFTGNAIAEKFMAPVSKGKVVLELKYNGKTPWWVADMIIRFNLKRVDFSKYRNSVAILRGFYRIPINK